MGFAGQVFAAKMAVGLAVPSTGALSRTGSLLAKGASAIYSSLNSQRKSQAQKRVDEAQAEVDKLSKLASNAARQNSFNIATAAAAGMKRIESVGGDAAAVLEKGGASAFQGMKQAMGQEGAALFAGVDKAAKPIERLTTLTRNFSKMSKADQNAAIKNSKEYVTAREKAVVTDKAALKDKIKEREEMTKGWKRITAGRQKQLDEIDAEIKKKKQLVEQGRQLRDEAKAEADVIGRVAVQARNAAEQGGEKLAKANQKLEDATDDLTEAQEELDKSTTDLTESSTNFGKAAVDTANEMKNNFNQVLVETIASLTAFYYKLNQNTEALVEFERELINANSVWQETDEVLFAASEQVTQFGQTFGMNMQNGATGLYQLASAGLTAGESMEVLGNTLKLSMAVQGDHNTIAKLTTQTLRGFDMEMTQSAEITDKFAHAIQKSLIEYEDLSSAVKFALPFFTSTGQSIDQLLGSLQILTNRALEAGIAGRGLRQALAQFAKHAEENDTAFRKMGISVLDAEGNMRQLNEIAADFAEVVGEDTVNNTELLTGLIDDLNVRGATAFVHLVQASDEFTQAVHETATAGGELDKMVETQNESLSAQMQILKNNIQFIFQHADASFVAEGHLNAFHKTVTLMIEDLQGLIVTGEDGNKQLTDFGLAIQEIAVSGMKALHELLMDIIPVIKEFSEQGFLNVEMLRLYTLPLRIVVRALELMGPELTKLALSFYIMNKILPITTIAQIAYNISLMMAMKAIAANSLALAKESGAVALNTTNKGIGTYVTMAYAKAKLFATGAATAFTGALGALTLATVGFWMAATLGAAALILIAVGIGKAIVKSETFQKVLEYFTEPGGALYRMNEMLKQTYEITMMIVRGFIFLGDSIAKVTAIAAKFTLSGLGKLGAAAMGRGMGRATGGYVQAMSSGGNPVAGGSYMVGERGPELFTPNQSGQVLNNTATNHIMQQRADSGFSNVGGGMVVSSLTVETAEMNQSNLNIDSFAGNPAMRRRAI